MSSDTSRVAFFKESLSTLHTAATKGFHSLKETAGREVETYRLFELPGDQCYVASRTTYMPDGYSQSIYPEDADKTLVPVVVQGDGNCLYRAMSLLLCGSEQMYTELRSRTVCEMILWPEFYTTGDTLAKEVVRNLAAISASFKEGHDLHDDETIMNIFQDECIAATRSGTYSSMWHIYGLASAVHCVLRSVYPQAAQRLRPILNSVLE